MEIAIAGWAFDRSILADRTMSLLEFPALARQEDGVGVVELVSELLASQTAGYRGPISFEYNFGETDEREGARKGLAYLKDQGESCGPW